jgi:hypothetical protein
VISGETLISHVSVPDQAPLIEIEPIAIHQVEFLKRDYSVCTVDMLDNPMGVMPLHYQYDETSMSVRVLADYVPNAELETHATSGEGFRYNADMSLARDENGAPIRTHSGSGTLFDLMANLTAYKADDHVISCGWDLDPFDTNAVLYASRLVSAHRKSGAMVTCLVEKRYSIGDDRPGLVWANGLASIHDLRDISIVPETVSTGVYVISKHALQEPMLWEYKRRRYHHNNKVWFQYERDLAQITRRYETNYVRI